MIEDQRAKAQEVLAELLSEELIPFPLTAYSLNTNGRGQYVLHFNDSRIHSCRFSWKEGDKFKEVVRAAVLERVDRMSGRLGKKLRRAK